jgi:hypothetical protein
MVRGTVWGVVLNNMWVAMDDRITLDQTTTYIIFPPPSLHLFYIHHIVYPMVVFFRQLLTPGEHYWNTSAFGIPLLGFWGLLRGTSGNMSAFIQLLVLYAANCLPKF